MNSKDLIKLLEADGWRLRSSKGSHHVFTHPAKGGHLSVPHPKKDLGTGLVPNCSSKPVCAEARSPS